MKKIQVVFATAALICAGVGVYASTLPVNIIKLFYSTSSGAICTTQYTGTPPSCSGAVQCRRTLPIGGENVQVYLSQREFEDDGTTPVTACQTLPGTQP